MGPLEPIDLNHAERIATLEESVKQVCESHIPHIWSAIRDIQMWVRGIGVAIILAIVGFIIDHFLGK